MGNYAHNVLLKELKAREDELKVLGAKKVGDKHQGFNTFVDVYRAMTELEIKIRDLRLVIRDMAE